MDDRIVNENLNNEEMEDHIEESFKENIQEKMEKQIKNGNEKLTSKIFGEEKDETPSTYEPSPWDESQILYYSRINRDPCLNTPGITIENGGEPTLIDILEILGVNYGKTYQVRHGENIDFDKVNKIRDSVANEYDYAAHLSIVSELTDQEKKDNPGKKYRIEGGRNRYTAYKQDYKDMPVYIVSGHRSALDLLGQKENNPSETRVDKGQTKEDVLHTVKKMFDYYSDTKGKYGIQKEKSEVIQFLKTHFPHLVKASFAKEILESAGIKQSIENYDQNQVKKILKENKVYTNQGFNIDGKEDNYGSLCFAAVIGRFSEEVRYYFQAIKRLVEVYVENPEYFNQSRVVKFITRFSMGEGVTEDPTSENLERKRLNVYPEFEEFVKTLRIFVRLYDDGFIIPKFLFLAQDNTKEENPENGFVN